MRVGQIIAFRAEVYAKSVVDPIVVKVGVVFLVVLEVLFGVEESGVTHKRIGLIIIKLLYTLSV